MPIEAAVILCTTALFAALTSAITGVAGGVMVLSVLVLFLPTMAVVPIHGVVQLMAGGSRMVLFRRFIQWPIVGPFLLAMVPGAFVGTVALSQLKQLNSSYVLMAIAITIALTLIPREERLSEPDRGATSLAPLFALGFICGILGMFVGSTGPLVSGWLLRNGINKEAHIACKSVMQGCAHFVKIPLFIIGLDFDFVPYLPLILAMTFMVIIGSWLGKIALKRLPQAVFSTIARLVLLFISAKIMITEFPKLL